MSTFAIAEPSVSHLMLSSRLVSELAQAKSTLRTTAERIGRAVVVSAGGELDASNEGTWRRLLSEAAAAADPPGSLVVDANGLDFMGCCAYAALAEEAERCRRRGVQLRVVSNQPIVSRIVAACGLGEVLAVDESVDAALSLSDPADW
ncbi:anti-sigma factor antagonist [Candidatus Mycobacterium methanotrophicum]|uniref:Anti-sigma factor antagonist n=1 Tax=Candidatus Mycobacterium methanotrophicum TaxID=2943498 RepID=A0ABY4QIN3_9MYCO|nr:anti-sigma factor antagonist [Candidatus Mycobacterium methanotrophicum]UQX10087.1 anti-sigma factor antagonist [Candidatus Mycobacterium methanotrophicum]